MMFSLPGTIPSAGTGRETAVHAPAEGDVTFPSSAPLLLPDDRMAASLPGTPASCSFSETLTASPAPVSTAKERV